MSADNLKALIRRIPLEAFNEGNVAVFDEVVDANAIDHLPPPGGLAPGREGYKQFVPILRAAFPDLKYTIEFELAEGDRAVHKTVARGTHLGTLFGIPPSGKQVTWTEIHALRFVDGVAVEHWGIVDQLGMLQQMGAIPAPG